MITQQDIEHMKGVADGVSAATALGVLLGALPHLAALLTVIWAALRIYEMLLSIKLKKRALADGDNLETRSQLGD